MALCGKCWLAAMSSAAISSLVSLNETGRAVSYLVPCHALLQVSNLHLGQCILRAAGMRARFVTTIWVHGGNQGTAVERRHTVSVDDEPTF
jgi:hypothetical protein